MWKIAFQSVIPKRSMGLSVSGAVAPSAPARRIMQGLVSSAGVFDLTLAYLAHEASMSMRRVLAWANESSYSTD
jgi:hypothetical protein